jgi:hypothetical protein
MNSANDLASPPAHGQACWRRCGGGLFSRGGTGGAWPCSPAEPLQCLLVVGNEREEIRIG